MIPRYGETPRPDIRYRLRPGAYAVILQGDSILTTFQADPEPEFQLPGGGIEAGESPTQGLLREVREETGWLVTGARRLGAYRRFCYMPEYDLWAEKLCTLYLARPVRQVAPPSEPGHSAVWMHLSNAVEMLDNSGERALLRRLL
ncbi:8-oxo-dGTP diphosphatase [Ketogulonicigenium robustum]|uniref:8-oxo-dGTP diphosphatase n=1 Tax=Ketogulonicigenium robustum TaxID=92947 RepID=A0A1W6P2H2_9RHOB|nr:NUDIX hydrolase [Ketogulonicigenium robustum]ARO15676.1 8-oxo-dGTP diphosphatase [Ketogulonicigenium robustum]